MSTRLPPDVWNTAPDHPELGCDLHIWRASLDVPRPELECLQSCLSPEELTRADQFRLAMLRDRFIAGRGMLRVLLGRYTERPPETIEFTYGPQGKPALAGGDLRFNLSHSQEMALFAFACGKEVGVDVECERENVECEGIARRFFSPAENAVLLSLPSQERSRAFFRCWTRKEAYIKALGGGLSIPLGRFDVSFHPDLPVRLIEDRGDPEAGSKWKFYEVRPRPGCMSAAVVETHQGKLRMWNWLREKRKG